jgi:hypothetical protein
MNMADTRLLGGLCALSMAAGPMLVHAADDAPSDFKAKVTADAKAFAEAVKRDSKIVAKTAQEGSQQVAKSAKEIAHDVAAASKQGAQDIADAAKQGTDKAKTLVKPAKTDAEHKAGDDAAHKP